MGAHIYRMPPAARRPPRSRAVRTPAAETQVVLDAFRSIVQALRESSRHTERTIGLTASQLFVLQKLAETGVASVNELAARTYTHQSSVSMVVVKLVGRGMVARKADPDDRRRVVLSLTPAGRRALESAPHAPQQALVAAVRRLSPGARRTLGRALAGIAQAMAGSRRAQMLLEEPAE
jgi:DNA-binding MarR family transcriptional regulator